MFLCGIFKINVSKAIPQTQNNENIPGQNDTAF